MALQRRLIPVTLKDLEQHAVEQKKKTILGRIEEVARLLYIQAYEAEFGGKSRGKFLVDREQLKALLNVKRLHPPTLMRLADECLERGLVLIDMDDKIGFAEVDYVENWRKLPTRLLNEYVSEMYSEDAEDDEESEDEKADGDDDEEDEE